MPTLSTIKSFSSMDMKSNPTTVHFIAWRTKISNHLHWNQVTLERDIPMIMVRSQNLSQIKILQRNTGWWSMGWKIFPHHMKSILVQAWYAFKVSTSNIIRYIFVKTKQLPFSPPKFTANTQACVSSIQLSSLEFSVIYWKGPCYLGKTRCNIE